MTLRAKYGVWLTRKRNCFSEMGTSSTSVIATAVALLGSLSINAISPKILSVVRSAIKDRHAHVNHYQRRRDGQVKTIHAEANQRVKKGDLLLEIDPAPYQGLQLVR
jgi:multidrug efflux pump subunit AcrA (membrane-fusion protein)